MRKVSGFLLSFSLALSSSFAWAGVTTESANIRLGESQVSGQWYIPTEQPAVGWVFLHHGFMRSPGHLKDLSTKLAESGVVVLTVSLSQGQMTSDSFAKETAETLALTPPHPAQIELPQSFVLAGHSLGGLFATKVSAELSVSGTPGFKGTLLFDPADRDDHMVRAAVQLRENGTPVLAILGEGGQCNFQSNATPILRSLGREFVGIRLKGGTHCDAEGGSTDFGCKLMCGSPKKANISALQEFGAAWLGFLFGVDASAHFPGGERYEALVESRQISALE
jgi:hypothetical protein